MLDEDELNPKTFGVRQENLKFKRQKGLIKIKSSPTLYKENPIKNESCFNDSEISEDSGDETKD